jgi:hypothetical protein
MPYTCERKETNHRQHPPVGHLVAVAKLHGVDNLDEIVARLILLHDQAVPVLKGPPLEQDGFEDVVRHVAASHILHDQAQVRPAQEGRIDWVARRRVVVFVK